MTEIALTAEMYAFSVSPGDVVELAVLEGGVDWSTQQGGPFAAEGRLTTGETREFDVPGIVSAPEGARIDLVYPQPPPPVDDNANDPDAGEPT